jgi:hypothetical protein
MGLVSAILGLPFAPLHGVIALGEVFADQVDEELYDLTSIRRDLEVADEAEAAGEISGEEKAEIQRRAVERAVFRRDADTETR